MDSLLVITSYISQSNIQPLSKFWKIISDLKIQNKILIITEKNTKLSVFYEANVDYLYINWGNKIYKKIISFLTSQIWVLKELIFDKSKIWVFYLSELSLINVVIGKVLGKNIVFLLGGDLISDMKHKNYNYFLICISKFIIKINFLLADKIVVFSPKLIENWKLEIFQNKIYIANRHFLDDNFVKITPIKDRKYNLGFIGRLSEEKGCLNYIKAIKILREKNFNINSIIIGDGYLKNDIIQYITNNNLKDCVDLMDWIDHKDLPNYLNKIKLLVIPSYTEGLPNIMIESMACGTPVLSNSVGAVEDYINDSINGFLMKNNSPEVIANNIIRSHAFKDFENMSNESVSTIKKNFDYTHILKNWNILFEELYD